jgi:hypothetical protein
MNNIEGSPGARLTAHAREVAITGALKRETLKFPSYLRVFHFFWQDFSSELRWRSGLSRAGFFNRLALTPASVAFV